MTDYCRKLWEEKQADDKATRDVTDAFDTGMMSGLKWGFIIFVPIFSYLFYLITY